MLKVFTTKITCLSVKGGELRVPGWEEEGVREFPGRGGFDEKGLDEN